MRLYFFFTLPSRLLISYLPGTFSQEMAFTRRIKTIPMETSLRFQFGSIPPDSPFYTRPGSYAVFFNAQGLAGVVRNDEGDYFLAGGGIEPGETKEAAIIREVSEETGLLVEIKSYLGVAAEYFYNQDSQGYVNKVGHFFLVQPIGFNASLKIEDDHTLLWLPVQEAYPLLYHDIYRWALDNAGS